MRGCDIIAMAAAACLVAACATSPGSAPLTVGKLLDGSWATLDGASKAADALVTAGLLKGQDAATVSADLTKAKDALVVAQFAYDASGEAADINAQLAIAATASAEILAITGAVH